MDNELRGAVLTKYRSIAQFAKELKWDRGKASRVVNRRQEPTMDDLEKMARLLDIHDEVTFVRVFLPSFSTLWNG